MLHISLCDTSRAFISDVNNESKRDTSPFYVRSFSFGLECWDGSRWVGMGLVGLGWVKFGCDESRWFAMV